MWDRESPAKTAWFTLRLLFFLMSTAKIPTRPANFHTIVLFHYVLKRYQRVDIPAHARPAHEGPVQKRLVSWNNRRIHTHVRTHAREHARTHTHKHNTAFPTRLQSVTKQWKLFSASPSLVGWVFCSKRCMYSIIAMWRIKPGRGSCT